MCAPICVISDICSIRKVANVQNQRLVMCANRYYQRLCYVRQYVLPAALKHELMTSGAAIEPRKGVCENRP